VILRAIRPTRCPAELCSLPGGREASHGHLDGGRAVLSTDTVSRTRWPVLVRRPDVRGDVATGDGGFWSVAVVPFPIPSLVAGEFGTFCADVAEPVVALTYDDGPHPRDTGRILDELARGGAAATFFVIAPRVVEHPDVARRIVAEGHELALHGAHHRSLLTMSDREAMRSIREARRVVEKIAGTRVRLYRPPYGEHTAGQAYALRSAGLDLVMWSGDAVDYVDDAEGEIVDRARSEIFPGGILLLHDDRADPETLQPGQELPRFDRAAVTRALLDRLRDDGYRALTVTEMLRRYRPVRSRSRSARARR
jgi:peptidoglycan-N-acetylglucosamine deacetylase